MGNLYMDPTTQFRPISYTVAIMDSVAFPKGLTMFQTMKVAYWSLFEKKKLYKFCEGVEKGKSLYFALKDVSQ